MFQLFGHKDEKTTGVTHPEHPDSPEKETDTIVGVLE